jgi:hypothetical protein
MKSIITGPKELTELISAVLNSDFSEKQSKVIEHILRNEMLKYEDVLSEVAEGLSYYQEDYTWVNELIKKINKVLYSIPKKKEL